MMQIQKYLSFYIISSNFITFSLNLHYTKKMKFFIKDFFSRRDQIHRKLQLCSHLLKKSLIENLIFCAVLGKFGVNFIS